jgi:hypothetical protein
MKKYLVLLLFISAFISQLSAYPKKSLVERYTNSGCGPCKVTNDNWYTATTQGLVGSNTISHIVYNVNWPDAQDPMYLFNSSDNTIRRSYYGVTSVPWMVVNGTTITMSNTSSSYLTNAVNSGNGQNSPFKIILSSDFYPNNMLNIHVKILREPSDAGTYLNTNLKLALTERQVFFPNAPGIGSNGERTFYSIIRKMLPDAVGTLLNPPSPGDSTELNFLYSCSSEFMQKVIMDSVRVVAFLQDDNSKMVYQSQMSDLNKTAHLVASPSLLNMGNEEIPGSSDSVKAVLLNWNTNACVISDIASQSGPFKVISNLNYPITINPFDSLILYFRFTPISTGVSNGFLSFTSNDPLFKGISLTGRGYKITATVPNTFYASSGANNIGKLLTIDPVSGSGTNIGLSLYNEIRSIAVNTKTGILYGISSNSVNTELVRINVSGGDSYNKFTFPLGDMSAVAFDKNGTLYAAMRSGLIYTIDLNSGNYTRVCSVKVKIQSLAFDPLNNELWGTYFAVIGTNKDKIFKINLSTGDTVSIGNTGTGIMTNSIAFDGSGNLFGLTGAVNQVGNFISINKSTGVGSIIGSTGITNLTGLTYSSDYAQGIIDSKNIPSDYVLEQNYPNPFNPNTSIRYSVPKDGFISLTVYNSLGQKTMSIVNGFMKAGSYEVNFNASSFSSGVYFYRLDSGSFSSVKKMVLIK